MLRVERLSKVYPRPPLLLRPVIRAAAAEPVEALRDVELTVDAGRIVGLVGPNGAGKTTLMKIIGTLLRATSGTVVVDGFDTGTDERRARARLGLVLAEDRAAYWRLTGRQNLEFFARMYGLDRRAAARRSDELLARVGLADADKRVFGYSAGMRSRLNLARALLLRPSVLVLDEPTRSLDPLASADTTELLREVAAEGCAILLSSHRLDEVADVADTVVVLVGGVVRFDGKPDDLAGDGTSAAKGLVELLQREVALQ